jgi:hypothetical protein
MWLKTILGPKKNVMFFFCLDVFYFSAIENIQNAVNFQDGVFLLFSFSFLMQNNFYSGFVPFIMLISNFKDRLKIYFTLNIAEKFKMTSFSNHFYLKAFKT